MTKHKFLRIGTTLLFVTVFTLIFFNRGEDEPDPRNSYEQYLLAEYAKLPKDIIDQSKSENRPDRPDLAAIQNYFSIVDPALAAVPSDRLKEAWVQTRLMQESSVREKRFYSVAMV